MSIIVYQKSKMGGEIKPLRRTLEVAAGFDRFLDGGYAL